VASSLFPCTLNRSLFVGLIDRPRHFRRPPPSNREEATGTFSSRPYFHELAMFRRMARVRPRLSGQLNLP
jgi:hypothetical protein